MTTNARDEKWSEWIEWHGDEEAPVDAETIVQWKGKGSAPILAGNLYWYHVGKYSDIIAYRYRLDDNQMTPEEEEIPTPEWSSTITDTQEKAAMVEDMVNDDVVPCSTKQLRYMDANGEDWIDEFARTASIDEFRGAMKFTIGKYNRRAGKKDELIKEIEKMRDYCDRWIKYERSL